MHFVSDFEPNIPISMGIFVSEPRINAYFYFLTKLPYAPNTVGNAAKTFDEVFFIFCLIYLLIDCHAIVFFYLSLITL